MLYVLTALAGLLTSSLVCSDALAAPKGFDVNDVTVLFPLDAEDRPAPRILLDDKLISSAVFDAVMREATEKWISAPQGFSILKRDRWQIVGFRYDPCAPSDSLRDTTCMQELRLVAQPFGEFGLADSSLHILYDLGTGFPAADDDVIEDLLDLRETAELALTMTTASEPLAVHPLLSRALQQGNEPVMQHFVNFIHKHAESVRLKKLTMMGLRDGSPIDWIFFGGNIKNGQWVLDTVPNIGQGSHTLVELNLGGGADVFTPPSSDPSLSLEMFFNSNPAGVTKSLLTLDEASHRLENPSLSDRRNADCVSCHGATTMRLSHQFSFRPFIQNLSMSLPQRITAFPGPQMLTSHPSHWNLRALGYFGLQPSVIMRTVQESARVAEQLNDLLGLNAPGRDCSKVSEAVMACFVDGSRIFGTVAPKESCLKLCAL